MTEPPSLLTLDETAAVLRCSKSHASRLTRGLVRGISPLPAIRLGRLVLVCREDLIHWLSQNFPGSVVR